ncbi:MAG: glycine C-acetyltransferase [Planctomycetota bacterium]
MFEGVRERVRAELDEIRSAGLYKEERVILGPQGRRVRVGDRDLLCLCANNYLGLSSDPALIGAAKHALDTHGLGLSSVRFICGTQDIHKQLERKIAGFLGKADAILYISCWDANGGLFETLMGPDDAIISDELNHASIIDGIRLSKAARFRYKNCDMADLERCLIESKGARSRLIATDGVFSMDGSIAPLDKICDLAEKYQAMVMVDDSHATGFVGKTGRGTIERFGVADRVDIVTTTFGKALGGACGGATIAHQEIVDLLRNRSRTYLFSNTMPPPVVGAVIACLDRLSATTELRDKLERNTSHFRAAMTKAGFAIKPGEHPIVPIMLGDARLAGELAKQMLDEGVYVIGFSFPVVPRGLARIRVQISAAHEIDDLDFAVAAFTRVGKRLGVLA